MAVAHWFQCKGTNTSDNNQVFLDVFILIKLVFGGKNNVVIGLFVCIFFFFLRREKLNSFDYDSILSNRALRANVKR